MRSLILVKYPSAAEFECPVCGTTVRAGARVCPECGADERTGWDEEATRYDGLDLPDAAYANDEGSEPDRPRVASTTRARFWWVVAMALTIIVIVLAVRG